MAEPRETKLEGTDSEIRPAWSADSSALLVLALAFGMRLWTASGTFLNPDEAMHYAAANQASLALAYKSSFALVHPPLLVLLLYFWHHVATSEFFLRLPLVFAGTAFCWLVFRWITIILGRTAGWIGLIFVSFLPPLIALSAEIRQYALLLVFAAATALYLERAFTEKSARKLWLSAAFLCLALLSHYSALLFAAAMGIYGMLRMVHDRPPVRLVISWAAGEAVALGLSVFLWITRLSRLGSGLAAEPGNQVWSSWYLPHSYFHPGKDNLFLFAIGRSFGVFQYLFGQLAVGDIAFIAFVTGIVLLARHKGLGGPSVDSRQIAILLALPFAVNCAAAIARVYPYGGSRHSVFLAMFALAGVSFSLTWFTRRRPVWGLGAALLIVTVCAWWGVPRRPYMLREDQNRAHMIHAIDAIHSQVPSGGRIFADYQTNFLLRHYLCPQADPTAIPFAGGFKTYQCGAYQLTITSPETNIFTAASFREQWQDLVRLDGLKPGAEVYVFQAGWDIHLADELRKNSPDQTFRDVKPQSFGRNITLFKLTAG